MPALYQTEPRRKHWISQNPEGGIRSDKTRQKFKFRMVEKCRKKTITIWIVALSCFPAKAWSSYQTISFRLFDRTKQGNVEMITFSVDYRLTVGQKNLNFSLSTKWPHFFCIWVNTMNQRPTFPSFYYKQISSLSMHQQLSWSAYCNRLTTDLLAF